MLGNRSVGVRTLSLLSLMLLVTAGYWGWLFIWKPELFIGFSECERYMTYNEFLLIGILFGLSAKEHSGGPHHEFVRALRLSGRQSLLGVFGILIVIVTVRDREVSRSFLFSFIPLLYLTLVSANYLVPKWVAQWAFSGHRLERVALAGTIEQAGSFKPWLDRKRLLGFRTIGVVCPGQACNGHSSHTNGASCCFPVLGCLDQMPEILQASAITQVIVLDLSLGAERLQRLTQVCEDAAVRLLALQDLDSYFNHTTTTFEDEGVRFIGLREEPLESPMNRFIKRGMDLMLALPVVTLVLPPVALMVLLLQLKQSPGPLLFKQNRIGMMGRRFSMYKFRSMHVHGGTESKQAVKDDPRVYPAGKWLRRFSIDELPQFLNVLRGDMSVVGPRPHLAAHEEMWVRVMRRYVIRRFIRPGLTGWAQVNGFRGEVRNEAEIQRRVEADIHYLENWSVSLDCLIILRTVKACVRPPGSAY